MVCDDLKDVFTAELAENAENKHIFNSALANFASACSAISSVAGGELVSKL
jgi:hypothetical protein